MSQFISLRLDSEIMNEGFTQETLEEFIKLGYVLYKQNVTKRLSDIVNGNIDMIISQRCEGRIENLQRENVDLVRKHELDKEHYTHVLNELKEEKKEMQRKLDALYKSVYEDSVQKLRSELREKECEINLLKNTNTVKGQLGESSIISSLRSIFTDATIENTGKTAHMCDVHMELGGNRGKYVFESKFKACIEKRDLDKFARDIEEMKHDIVGGIFVSLCTRNIPHKGEAHFEYIGGVPVLYIGFDRDDDFERLFPQYVKMFVEVCETYKEGESSKNDVEERMQVLMEDYKYLNGVITRNKKRLEDIKVKFMKYYQDVDDDNKAALQRMESIIGTSKKTPKRKQVQT